MRSVTLLVAGVLMLLSALAHAKLGWPAMLTELQRAGAGPDLIGGLAAGWLFGSAAMAGFGAIVVLVGLRLRRGDASGAPAVRLIAATYVVYGVVAFLARDFNAHFLLFVLTGVLAGIPVLGLGTRLDAPPP